MRVAPPVWLNSPIVRWLPCEVLSDLQPQGFLVEFNIEGQGRSIVVPYDSVRVEGPLPATGELRVVVIAELPEDKSMLAELPNTPLDGSQRLKVSPEALRVA